MYFFFQHGDISLGEPSGRDFRENVVEYGAIPYEITHPGEQCAQPGAGPEACGESDGGLAPTWLTLLTSMFMHGGLLHLGGNMLFLWIFGDNLEDRLGHLRYLAFYLLTGVLASLAHVFSTVAFSEGGSGMLVPSLGASGAISGVLGGYILLFPHNPVRVILLRMLTTVPAYVALGLWFLFQFVSGLGLLGGGAQEGGVAYAAHIGGFIAGLALVKFFAIGLPAAPARRGRY